MAALAAVLTFVAVFRFVWWLGQPWRVWGTAQSPPVAHFGDTVSVRLPQPFTEGDPHAVRQ